VVSLDDGVDSVCCCWSSLMPTLTDSDILNLLTICPLFFSSSNSSPFVVRHFSGHLFSDPFLHVLLSAHRPCWAAVSGHYLSGSWRLCCVLTCDETQTWRVKCVTRWLCDDLTVWQVEAEVKQDSTEAVGTRPRHLSFLPRGEAAASRTYSNGLIIKQVDKFYWEGTLHRVNFS